ncbi:MAG: pyruvate ferredoxin oxidoreductase, partial [Candidatus Eisenbacteria bacterium]|nr:pyruvate ferredoxin oxidoreductase [Candidatus Eisenbacteria bacterium]
MPSLTRALDRLRRLLGSSQDVAATDGGIATVLDGASALAVVEGCLSEAAGLGAGARHTTHAWRGVEGRERANVFAAPLEGIEARSARGALASAVGLGLTGVRATAFVSGPELGRASDLLDRAAGGHLPLVVHLLCGDSGGSNVAGASGGGHAAYHTAADAGCGLLFAADVQEAIDLTLIARRAAERALIPVVVAIDGDATARGLQDVRVPSPEMIRSYVGAPDD